MASKESNQKVFMLNRFNIHRLISGSVFAMSLFIMFIFVMPHQVAVAQSGLPTLLLGQVITDSLSSGQTEKCYSVPLDAQNITGFSSKITPLNSALDVNANLYGVAANGTRTRINRSINPGGDSIAWKWSWGAGQSIGDFMPMPTYSVFELCIVPAGGGNQARNYRIYSAKYPEWDTAGTVPQLGRLYWSTPMLGCIQAASRPLGGRFATDSIWHFAIWPVVGGRNVTFQVEAFSAVPTGFQVRLQRSVADQTSPNGFYDARPVGDGYSLVVHATKGAGCYRITIHSDKELD